MSTKHIYLHRGRARDGVAKIKLTPEQKKALEYYEFCLREEDRYLGSVFVTSSGQRRVEEKTKEAYERCKRLGMTYEHGL